MAPPSSLIVKAGPTALATIRHEGLRPEYVAVIPGAAGGTKTLGIIGLDSAIFGEMVSESAHNNTRQLLAGYEAAVLSHPTYRLHVIASRGLGMLTQQSRLRTPAGFALAAMVNALGRKHLRHLAERMRFNDACTCPTTAPTA